MKPKIVEISFEKEIFQRVIAELSESGSIKRIIQILDEEDSCVFNEKILNIIEYYKD